MNAAGSTGPRVLLMHPGRQHSHQLALALHEVGLLGMYVHGSPVPERVRSAIPTRKRMMLPIAPLGRRLANKLPSARRAELSYRFDRTYDALVSSLLPVLGRFDAVIGYENACAKLFSKAGSRGALCILDAASVHHTFQDRQVEFVEDPAFHQTVTARKDMEVALASQIIVCSRLAADTYADAGVPQDKLNVVPLGTETALEPTPAAAPSGSTRFLFVGRFSRHKGLDILLEACDRLRARGTSFELTVVADSSGAEPAVLRKMQKFGRLLSPVPAAQLREIFAAHDCLVLPSRFDSFGLVVPEALACGCLAIVSSHAGSNMLIREGENGYIFPNENVDVLSDRMSEVTAALPAWRAKRSAIADQAHTFDWSHYRSTVSGVIGRILQHA